MIDVDDDLVTRLAALERAVAVMHAERRPRHVGRMALGGSCGEEARPGRCHRDRIAACGILAIDGRVLHRRPVAPHPRATLFVTRERGARKSMVHADLPIVLPRSRVGIDVSDLRSFDRSRRRRQRSDTAMLELLLDGSNVYIERPATTESRAANRQEPLCP